MVMRGRIRQIRFCPLCNWTTGATGRSQMTSLRNHLMNAHHATKEPCKRPKQ